MFSSYTPDQLENPPKTPDQTTTPPTDSEISALQDTAEALINKIHKIRSTPYNPTLNPEATPFKPTQIKNLLSKTTKKHHNPRKRLRWSNEPPQIHQIEPNGKQLPTTQSNKEDHSLRVEERSRATDRSKRHRDQAVDIAVTLHLIHAKNDNIDPKCPSPKDMFKKQPRTTPKLSILKRPRGIHNPLKSTNKTSTDNPPKQFHHKTLQERQVEYEKARAWIFGYGGGYLTDYYPP